MCLLSHNLFLNILLDAHASMRMYSSMHDFMIVIFVELNISYAIFIPKFEGGLEILGSTPSVCYNLSCAEIAASIMAIV